MPNRWLKPLSVVTVAVVVAGCGAAPLASPAARPAVVAGARSVSLEQARLEGPVTARAALAFAHVAARQLDGKAAFLTMAGTRIQPDGTPTKTGQWQIAYIGDVVPQAGRNPYNRIMRRIVVTIAGTGEVSAVVSEDAGLPLGVQLLEDPMPALDSSEAIAIARRHTEEPYSGPVAKLVLCSQMSPKMFNRLVWKVTTTAQGGDTQVALDAGTGEVLSR